MSLVRAAVLSTATLGSSSTIGPAVIEWWAEPMKTILCEPGMLPRLKRGVWGATVVAPDDVRIGAVGIRGPELHERPVGAVHVVPSRVEDAAVGGDGGRPFEALEGGDSADAAAAGVHRVQGVDRDRCAGPAAAPHVAVAQGRLRGGLGGGPADLEATPAPRREEQDSPIRQVSAVEVVVLAAGHARRPVPLALISKRW